MKTQFFFILLAISSFLAGSALAQDYTFNIEDSKASWLGEKVTGEHAGTVSLKSGSFTIADNKLTKGEIVIDMTTIVCTDLKGPMAKKLVGHLKSDDFFGVKDYPTASFTLTEAAEIKGGNAVLKGKLTVKGKTLPAEFKVVVEQSKNEAKLYGNIVIDRTKYDVRYGSGSFFDSLGDKTIYDEFKIKLNLAAK